MFTLDQYIQFFLIGASVGTVLALTLGKRPNKPVRKSSSEIPAELRAAFEAPIDGRAVLQDLQDRGIIKVVDEMIAEVEKKEETAQ